MRRFLAIYCLLAAKWISLSLAGDSCPIEMKFCSCFQYPIQMHSNGHNISRSIAPTTAPKPRDPFRHTVVECHFNNTDTSSLTTMASKLHRKLVDKLRIVGMPLEKERVMATLPSKWLVNIRVRQFEITQTSLAGDFLWQGHPFAGQEHTMVWLAAVGCSLTGSLTYSTLGTVNLKGLEDLPSIEGLDLSMNHLVSIESSAFSQPHRLQTVVLSKNAIQNVFPGAFINLQRLRLMDLSHNLLTNISREIFAARPKLLRNINLSWNRLNSLPKNLFSDMTALRAVDVSYNYLYSLPEEPWKSVWRRLKQIDVSGNFIKCDCELLWMLAANGTDSSFLKGRSVKGECSRALPHLFEQHFQLTSLTRDKVRCDDDDDYEDGPPLSQEIDASLHAAY